MFNRNHIRLFLILIPLIGCACSKWRIYSLTETISCLKEWKEVVKENQMAKPPLPAYDGKDIKLVEEGATSAQ
ncbi:MAG: hypothetical protein HY026_09785 [Deltaproteobacteria bacterium]|nr:hypothetical protein [Deltaproteobacteria bacterium]